MTSLSTNPNQLQGVASTYGEAIITNIQREYPNIIHHLMTGPEDRPTPREIHPAFYGCLDWHSSVHMHWSLVCLLRKAPEALDTETALAVLKKHFTQENLRKEAAYFETRRSFERPYGWGWALTLARELHDWEHPSAKDWAASIQPLADMITALILEWLPKATYPIRIGMHSNSAFGLTRSLPWARRLAARGDARLLDAITETATRWFIDDRDYPANWEPNGSDFLSPALTEAELMCEVLDASAFLSWLDGFLPGLAGGQQSSVFEPVTVSDETDGQTAHLHGLNLYRAYAWQHLSSALPGDDPRVQVMQQAATLHAEAGLPAVTGSHYMAEHWLASFAMLYFGVLEDA